VRRTPPARGNWGDSGERQGQIAVPGIGFELVSRTDVTKTRPALDRAGYRCEHCRSEDGLRVVEGFGQLVVLCPKSVLEDGFKKVLAYRKAQVRRQDR